MWIGGRRSDANVAHRLAFARASRERDVKRPEQILARSVAEYLALCLPSTVYFSAINPVPGKSKAAAAISKALGMKAGIPDYIIVHNGIVHFVELKSAKGGLSTNQRIAHAAIVSAGGHVAVTRSLDELQAQLRFWKIPLQVRML